MAVTARKKAKRPADRAASLKTYQRKRDFSKTSEPSAGPRGASGKQRFVVQKHDARRLHFDLRLELEGVLKSWAVTKGPSMTAGVRRLAVETEDHPIGYIDWEGVIPKGQYGGGTMIIWDQGTWSADGDATAALKAGKLSFQLSGQRLKGRWTLVRMKPEGKRQNWLLIKGHDEHALGAGRPEPVDTEMSSLKSGRANSDLEGGPLRPDHKARQKKAGALPALSTSNLKRIEGAAGGILPAFVAPSLAISVTAPPRGKQWIHEIKHDGYRMQARVEGGDVSLLTRKGLDWTARFPPVAARLAELPVGAALIDGEIVVQDASGHSNFSGLQDDLKAKRHNRLVYFVFDILHCNGVDLRDAPLAARKEVLRQIIEATPHAFALRFSDHLGAAPAKDILGEACRLGLEGIVSKRLDLPYVSGRGDHWQKSKCTLRQEFIIAGFVRSAAQPRAVGSLVLAYHEGAKLVHAGRAGTGLDAKGSAALAERLEPMRSTMPEFATAPSPLARRGVIWVRPELAAEIEYRGWSSQCLLRQAAIKGLRDDKPAAEIVLEHAEAPHDVPTGGVEKPVAGSRAVRAQSKSGPAGKSNLGDVVFTHPEKLLWPDVHVSKRMLADYYVLAAERCLPHVAGRVLALLRCPEGTSGQCFFAKHAWMGTSQHIRQVDAGSEKPMLAIDDAQGLASLVQMNVLEIHVWGSQLEKIEKPDRIIFDLDPDEAVTWATLRAGALEVRDRLAKLGLASFVKSTGGKGLHVVAPVEPDKPWDQVKDFAKAFAMVMAQDSPATYLAVMSKARRKGRIFVDYLRNGRGATAIAPYSTRARPKAPIALPLAWDDLKGEQPRFTVADILKAGKLPPDPWGDFRKVEQKLPVFRMG